MVIMVIMIEYIGYRLLLCGALIKIKTNVLL